MWRAIGAIACAVLLTVLPPPALAAPGNGQLAAVVDDQLVTLNPDGSGLRTLWTAPRGEVISGLTWSPDGNRLAFAATRRIAVYDLLTGRLAAVTNPPGDAVDADPGWSADGTRIGFRRANGLLQTAMTVDAAGGDPRLLQYPVAAATTALAWQPNLSGVTLVVGNQLVFAGLDLLPPVVGAPAWAPDGSQIAFANADGLHALAAGAPAPSQVAAAPAGPPRWSPDAAALAYPAGAELRIVAAAGGASRRVLTAATGVATVDWQPCTAGRTARCESVAPPRCSVVTLAATTQTDQPVDLPAPPCSDPAGRELSLVMVKAPDHGTLAGRRYTPAPGFAGHDVVAYRVSNGVAESELVRVTIFVVPRPTAAPQPAVRVPLQRAPFLSARAIPRLDGRRRARVRVSCDQDCTLAVRLTGRLRSKRALKGPLARRTLVARQVVSVRLRLPKKPHGRVKTVWIIGSVRNAVGVRSVKLPVRLTRPR